eukprot:14059241-Ditylum_brightwellii.AAC.1
MDEILLIINANGTIEDDDFGNFLAEANLYNIIKSKHGMETPTTYIRGKKDIDHIVGTEGWIEAAEEIRFCKMFRGLLHQLQQQNPRKVILKKVDQVVTYLKLAMMNILELTVFEDLTTLRYADKKEEQEQVEQLLDKIDRSFHDAIINVSESLPEFPIHWWTEDVHHANQLNGRGGHT